MTDNICYSDEQRRHTQTMMKKKKKNEYTKEDENAHKRTMNKSAKDNSGIAFDRANLILKSIYSDIIATHTSVERINENN